MSSQRIAVEIGVAHTTPKHGLGELHIDEEGNHYRYMQADGAVTKDLLYNYVPGTWQIDSVIKLAVNPADGKRVPCCVSPVNLADDEYAWVFVGPGAVTLTAAGAVAASAVIYGVNGNGTVDDAATACLLPGLTLPAAISSAGTGTFYATQPLVAEDLP